MNFLVIIFVVIHIRLVIVEAQSWETLKNSHIYEKVLEKYLTF